GLNLAGIFITANDGKKPGFLCVIELIAAGVIERDEVDIVADPVVIGAEQMILGVVFEALRLDGGRFQPVRELGEVLFAARRRYGFVITRSEADRRRAEGRQLVGNKI